MKCLHIFVSGIVQGVGFRYFTKRVAEQLNLCGWVRNLPDGRVEIEVEGSEDALKEFLSLIKKGPSLARVDEVVIKETDVKGYKHFEIRF